jgi:exosortase/archaeosortase
MPDELESGTATNSPTAEHVARIDDPNFSMALSHAWAWFSQHANQRMQALNYYLVAMAFLTAAYVNAMSGRHWPMAAAVAAVGIVVSLAFNQLDTRTRALVQAAEPSLEALQQALLQAGYPGMDMLAASSRRPRRVHSYRVIIASLTTLGVLAFVAGLIIALIKI